MSFKRVIIHKGVTLALHIVTDAKTKFYTQPEELLQLASFNLCAGYEIRAHKHTLQTRTIVGTPECLIIQDGSLLYSIYDMDDKLVASECEAEKGDVLLLLAGGHSFRAGKYGCKMLEVKLGPYRADCDKEYLT